MRVDRDTILNMRCRCRLGAVLCTALLAVHIISAKDREWDQFRQQIAAALHVPQPLPALRERGYGSFAPVPDVTAERIAYSTAYDLRVPAIVYRPGGATIIKHPALVIVNGHGGDKSSWYAYYAGILFARAGAVVLTYDPIGEFERNAERQSNTSQHDQVLEPADMAPRMGGLMVTDVMQAVSYLANRKDVDPKRIAVLGYSMGSFISSLACAVDTQIHACVLVSGGDLDGPDGYWDRSRKMCQAGPYQALKFLGDRGAVIFALHAKRGPTLIWNGSADDVVDIPHHGEDFFADLKKRTVAEAGSGKNVFEYGFTANGGHRPYYLSKPVALWLEDKLKFPNWTDKQLKAMPEIRISDWAAKNNIQSKSFANQHNEGGLMALDSSIPAVSRDDLHALPEAVWDSQRDNFVYETWVSRAKTAVQSNAP